MPVIDLSKNESPWSIFSAQKLDLSSALVKINHYPDEANQALVSEVSRKYNIDEKHFILTRGIDDAMDSLLTEFRHGQFHVVWPGFDGYVERLEAVSLPYSTIQLEPNVGLSLNSISKLTPKDFCFVSDPHNPTSEVLSESSRHAISQSGASWLIDETYTAFAEQQARPIEDRIERHWIFRSFSKEYGLAGARAGILFGPERSIQNMKQRQWYCPFDTLTAQLLLTALKQDNTQLVEKVRDQTQKLLMGLKKLGFSVRKSQTNFVTVNTEVFRLVNYLRPHGIVVRSLESMGMPNHVRISCGTDPEQEALLGLLKSTLRA